MTTPYVDYIKHVYIGTGHLTGVLQGEIVALYDSDVRYIHICI